MTNWFLETLSHILVHHSTMTYSFHSISIKCFVFFVMIAAAAAVVVIVVHIYAYRVWSDFRISSGWTSEWNICSSCNQQSIESFTAMFIYISGWTGPTSRNYFYIIQFAWITTWVRKIFRKKSFLLTHLFNLNIIFIHATVERPLAKFHRKYKIN